MRLGILRTAGMILLALLGSAGLLALLVSTTLLLTAQSKDAADVLPAEGVILTLFSPTVEDIERWVPWFPLLSEVTLTADTEAVAIVMLQNEQLATVTLARAAEGEGTYIAPFLVTASAPEAIALVHDAQAHLSQLRPVRILSRGRQADASWATLDMQFAPKALRAEDRFLRQILIGNSRFVALQSSSGTLTIDRVVEQVPQEWIGSAPLQTMTGAFIHIVSRAPFTHIAETIMMEMPDMQTQLRSVFLSQFHTLFGEDVSLEFDIAPLMQDETDVLLGRNASGTLLFGVRGAGTSADQVTAVLERVRASTASNDNQVEVRTRTFDDRFEAKDIRMRQEASAQKVTEQEGWTIMHEQTADRLSPLWIGQRGEAFILTNDVQIWDMLRSERHVPVPLSAQREASRGYVATDELQTWLQEPLMTNIIDISSPFLPSIDGKPLLQWRTARENDRIRTTVESIPQ